MTTLVSEFTKIENDDKTRYNTFYPSSKAETTTNKIDINDVFDSICNTNISRKRFKLNYWVSHNHNINISKCNPLAGSKNYQITKRISPFKERFDDIQDIDNNECFKWCLVIYLHSEDFCCHCLQAFSIEEILKRHIKDYFNINGKQRIKMSKNC